MSKATLPALVLFALIASAQSPVPKGEWRHYGADAGSTHYSALDQVNAQNFGKLELAWRFKTSPMGPRKEFNLQSTPLMANGVVYSTAGTRRAVVALDAVTGELIWMHSEREGQRGSVAPRQLSGRGLAYWTDGREERILYVTPGYQLVALDAKTGVKIANFGAAGMVDLKMGDDQVIDLLNSEIGLHATPAVAGDVVIIGAAGRSGGVPKSKTNVKGYVRGFDVRTGKRLWIFHTIPLPGEAGYDTWEKDSSTYTGNAGVWGQITIDEQLGIAYIPIETPTGDYYGGHRPGNGLFGETLLAVDLKTGKRKWHYQLVHHGVWDFDIPCAPILVDATVNGRVVKAVAQPTKQAFLYVFDRVTGQPIWPIEERPVPKGSVPGEWYSPTQPFPTKPAAYDFQGLLPEHLIDFTPALKAAALERISHYQTGPIFTPPVVSKAEGPIATLTLASAQGGTVWQGGSYDPETRTVYVPSQHSITTLGLVKPDAETSDFNWVQGTATQGVRRTAGAGAEAGAEAVTPLTAGGGFGTALTIEGLSLVKPPYGSITAINMDTGEIKWQIAHGDTPDEVKNHPLLKGLNIPRTGRPGIVGTLVTRTLLIAGEPGFNTLANGQKGAYLRAYDKGTGRDAGVVAMPAPQTGTPMTYEAGGKQYIIVAVGGPGYEAELLAYRLGN